MLLPRFCVAAVFPAVQASVSRMEEEANKKEEPSPTQPAPTQPAPVAKPSEQEEPPRTQPEPVTKEPNETADQKLTLPAAAVPAATAPTGAPLRRELEIPLP